MAAELDACDNRELRSTAEIRFRLRQEAANAWLLMHAPSLPAEKTEGPGGLAALPSPNTFLHRFQGTRAAEEIVTIASAICEHRFPLLGYTIETGDPIAWRRDYIHGIETGTGYFRRIPYLDAGKAGDHKVIWELNRHQHLVLLAKAWLLTGDRRYPDEIERQLRGWWEQNPFQRGINWTSALEAAFRALSWIWLYHLAGNAFAPAFRRRILNELYRHGLHLQYNLSVYFSPNTHLLGEAVALHALGALFPAWPRSAHWRAEGGRIVREEMERQVRADGSHFEQSSAYHVYAVDFFVFHALLEPPAPAYLSKLHRMADYLAALQSADGWLPLLGDDDGGNFFHPFGEQRRFGRSTLACCNVLAGRDCWDAATEDLFPAAAWWFGERAFASRPDARKPAEASLLFADAGVAVLSHANTRAIVDMRAFGHANAGHSHAHALHLVCRRGGEDILIDPGTYTYVGDPKWRAAFRGTGFHNTVRIDGLDQADGSGPFRWTKKPVSKIASWSTGKAFQFLDAVCEYRGFTHRRRVVWLWETETLAVVDTVAGEPGIEHTLEQFWHCGAPVVEASEGRYRIGEEACLLLPAGSSRPESGWCSDAPGRKEPAPVIVVAKKSQLPAAMPAVLCMGEACNRAGGEPLQLQRTAGALVLQVSGMAAISFREEGDPILD